MLTSKHMSDAAAEMVTVFRSGDAGANEEASIIVDVLADAGLNAMMLTDDYPGVLTGTVEVRVPASEEEAALDALDAHSATMGGEEGSPSHGYDLVELYRGQGSGGEVESLSIRAVLDANHIPSVLVGSSQLPNLAFRVMVPQVFAEAAQQALDEAEGAGPAAADEAEAASENAKS
jgi:hypothetical protein